MIDLLMGGHEGKLSSHPVYRELRERQIEISNKAEGAHLGEGDNIYEFVYQSASFSEEEKFTYKTTALLQEIHFKLDKVQQCAYMLDFYPTNIKTAWFTPLTEGEYIEHIMELYSVHSIGLIDRVLRAYAFLFSVKIGKGQSKLDAIIRAIDKEYALPLVAFNGMLGGIKQSRNAIVHEYRYDDRELLEISLEDMRARDEFRSSTLEAQRIFAKLEKKYDKKVHQLWNTLAENDKLLMTNYMDVFEVFAKQYRKRSTEMEA